MKLLLLGKEEEWPNAGQVNVAQLLAAIQDRLLAAGHVLQELLVDGRPVEGDPEQALGAWPPVRRLEVRSSPAAAYLGELALTAADFLRQKSAAAAALGEDFYAGLSSAVWERAAAYLADLELLFRLLADMRAHALLNSAAARPPWSDLAAALAELSAALPSLQEAIARRDTVLAGDLFYHVFSRPLQAALAAFLPPAGRE